MREVEQRTALEPHRSGVGRVERERNAGQRRFSGTGFADDPERMSGDNAEADAGQRGTAAMRAERARSRQTVSLDEIDNFEERRLAHAPFPISRARWQRERRSPPKRTSGGGVVRQMSMVSSQRPANGQPAPISWWMGGEPGMVLSRRPRDAPGCGRASRRARV